MFKVYIFLHVSVPFQVMRNTAQHFLQRTSRTLILFISPTTITRFSSVCNVGVLALCSSGSSLSTVRTCLLLLTTQKLYFCRKVSGCKRSEACNESNCNSILFLLQIWPPYGPLIWNNFSITPNNVFACEAQTRDWRRATLAPLLVL